MSEEVKAAKCGTNPTNEGGANAGADSSDGSSGHGEAAAAALPGRKVLKARRPYAAQGRLMEGITVGVKFFKFDHKVINLDHLQLSAEELQPLLDGFKEGKFLALKALKLVLLCILARVLTAAGSHSCAAAWKRNWKQRRVVHRRGAEGQQQPDKARSCKFFCYLMYDGLSFVFVLRERARRGRAAV
jgi:hypothetical protein